MSVKRPYQIHSDERRDIAHTIEIAAFVARILGRGRSALGAGGGRAASWGDAGSAERSFAEGVACAGIVTGGVSPRGRVRVAGIGGILDVLGEYADIMACR